MAPASQSAEQEPFFGLIHGFSLGTLLLLSALLAVPLHKLGWDWSISHLIPYHGLGGIFWGVELVLYAVLAWVLSRHLLVTFCGPILGLITRFIVTFLIGLLVSAQSDKPLSDILLMLDREMWLYRVVAILMTAVIMLFPFRQTFQSGFGLLAMPSSGKGGGKTPSATGNKSKQFSFASKAPHTGNYQVTRSSPQGAPSAAPAAAPTRQHILTPPEGVTPVIPRDNVFGAVSVPASVVLQCVPEAQPFLETDRPVSIHLAYLVPQMPRGTAWLLWQQIFSGGAGTRADGGADAGIRDRWVRISPKYYITQVPREYFEMQRTPTAWMRLPEVPQEQQFHFDE
jgi:hypothetical protein